MLRVLSLIIYFVSLYFLTFWILVFIEKGAPIWLMNIYAVLIIFTSISLIPMMEIDVIGQTTKNWKVITNANN